MQRIGVDFGHVNSVSGLQKRVKLAGATWQSFSSLDFSVGVPSLQSSTPLQKSVSGRHIPLLQGLYPV
jgi:hypothetical protein